MRRLSTYRLRALFVRMHLHNCLAIKARTLPLNHEVEKRIMHFSCGAWSGATSEKKSGLTLSSGFYAHWTTSVSCNALSPSLRSRQWPASFRDRSENFYRSYATRDRLSWIAYGEIEIGPPSVLTSNCATALSGIDNNFAAGAARMW